MAGTLTGADLVRPSRAPRRDRSPPQPDLRGCRAAGP